MLIRSACAGGVAAVLIPDKGSAPLSPLVIKASAGSLFRCPIVRCGDLAEALPDAIRQVRAPAPA